MLNEKEKKAIERLKERVNDNEDYKTIQVWLTDDVVAVETILNLTTKLQKENEEKDTEITELNEYLEVISQCLDNIAIDQIPIAIAEIKWDNMLKDKQIDLMADKLVEAHERFYSEFDNFTKEDFIKHFRKLAIEKGK